MTARKAYAAGDQLFHLVGDAIDFADAQALELHTEVKVIHRATECIVHTSTWVPAEQHFTPWTRVEQPKFATPDMSDYVLAYTRKRIATGVYRHIAAEGWRIVNNVTGDTVDVANTWEARMVTNAMGAGTWDPETTLVEANREREAAKAASKVMLVEA